MRRCFVACLLALLCLADSLPAAPAAGGAIPTGHQGSLEAHVVSDTPWTTERPRPTATYGSFRTARSSLERIVRGALGAFADSARWQPADTSFVYRDQQKLVRSRRGDSFWVMEDRDAPIRVAGVRMTFETVSAKAPGVERIAEALQRAGWAEDMVYSADGPDGTSFAYVCREALCVVQASWDGGDDTDTTYVPVPGESVSLICVPRLAEPAPRR